MMLTLAQQQLLTSFNQIDTVLIISSYPSKGGESSTQNAVANYTRELAQSMAKKTPVVVVCEKIDGEETVYIEKNVLVIRAYTKGSIRMSKEIATAVSYLPQVETIMVQFEFNIFGTPLVTTTFIPLLFWMRQNSKKITFVFHQVVDSLNELGEHLGLSTSFSLKTALLNMGMRWFYRSVGMVSDGVVVHTEQLRNKLRSYISDHKISIIPHGVSAADLSISKIAARKKLKIAADEKVLLVFGYINWYKGSDWIIKTIGELAQNQPGLKLKLILAGGESVTLKDRPHYQLFIADVKALQKKFQNTVMITGYVPDSEKLIYFQAADIVVLPYRVSMSESGPLSHAFAYGKPFMVSEARYSSLISPDISHNFAVYEVDPQDITFSLSKDNFSHKLINLLTNSKQLTELGLCSAAIGENRSWNNISNQYIRALHKGYARSAKQVKEESNKIPELSVFFPLHNEEENIGSLVNQAVKIIPNIAEKHEILLVNDGSTDNTGIIAEKIARKFSNVRVIHQKNLGYGGALKRGFSEAKYEWIFFSDGDLQFDLAELAQFIPFTNLHDLIIGYRINRAEGFARAVVASLLKVWNKVLLSFPLEIKDIDCAFKLIHKNVLREIGPLDCDGAMLSTELLAKAYQHGFSFTQIGVSHYQRAAGTATGLDFKVVQKAIRETLLLRQTLHKRTIATHPSMISL